MYDCIIIGAGIIGCALARRLSEYKAKVLVIEKEDDVCAGGASRANSGIIHAGFDCEPGTNKAKYNTRGNPMFDKLCEDLDVPFKRIGSLVCGGKEDLPRITKLYDKGVINGVDVEILDRAAILELEPNVSDNVCYALYAKNAGIISPYKFTIACANYAALNGVEFLFETKVTDINEITPINQGKYLEVVMGTKKLYAKTIVNCSGAGSMELNMKAGAETYENEYARGEYILLDKTEGQNIGRILFPLPDERGKGILVAPTVDGNVIYGPTSIRTEEPNAITTAEGLELIKKSISRIYSKGNFKKIIRVYSGVRVISGSDFIIKKSEIVSGYIFCLGICSPGLSSSPAIAEKLIKLLSNKLNLTLKKDCELKKLAKHIVFRNLTDSERTKLVAENSAYGKIVCRCETVTEAEIVEAIHSPIVPHTVDAIKRRVRSGMGRCQGGFCASGVMEILSRELGIPFDKIKKGGAGSEIIVGKIKE